MDAAALQVLRQCIERLETVLILVGLDAFTGLDGTEESQRTTDDAIGV